MDTNKFRHSLEEVLFGLVESGSLGSTAIDSVMLAFDEVAKGPEQRASDLLGTLETRTDTTFVLYGRLSRFPDSAGLDGHAVGYVKGGNNAPFRSPPHSTKTNNAKLADRFVHGESAWQEAKKSKLINMHQRAHDAAVVRYQAGDGSQGIVVTVNDQTIDDRPGSHTDFHVVGPEDLVDELWQLTTDVPGVMVEAMRTAFPGVDVLREGEITIKGMLDIRTEG